MEGLLDKSGVTLLREIIEQAAIPVTYDEPGRFARVMSEETKVARQTWFLDVPVVKISPTETGSRETVLLDSGPWRLWTKAHRLSGGALV